MVEAADKHVKEIVCEGKHLFQRNENEISALFLHCLCKEVMVNMDMVLNCEMKKPEPRTQYEKSCNERVNEFYEDLTDAAEKSKSHAVGNTLSLTTIPYSETMSYGMAAFHSDKSTVNDPIIKISCNYGGEQRYYDVHVNEVNPHNASAIEMFAVCAYLDEQGVTDKGTFGSYNKIKVYGQNASDSGEFLDLQDSGNYNIPVDWIKMLREMAQLYLENSRTYEQSLDASKLADVLMNIKENI